MRPERNQLLLATAFLWAKKSTCDRLHVGAVFARDGRILVQGYNGAPAGQPHCNHQCDCIPYQELTQLGAKRAPIIHELHCRSLSACTVAVHAEANGIAYAARWGVGLEGSQLFCTHQPCLNCSMLIVGAGIETVFYSEEYRLKDGIQLLERSGIKVLRHENPTDSMGL